MFQPRYFKQQDEQAMYSFIEKHSLATLVSETKSGLLGNHIPMIVIQRDNKYYLQGHMARVNSLWQVHKQNTDILAIFNGPDSYISPSWYPSKQKEGKAVPTWNYTAVHVSGSISFFHETQWLLNHLDNLSQFNERDMPNPWKLSDAPEDYIAKMLGAIVGLEIEVKQITGQSKMSQNHPESNRQGVIDGLKSLNKDNVANWVENPNM